MSVDTPQVTVDIAGHETDARILDQVWSPEYNDPRTDVLVDVDGQEWWVSEDDILDGVDEARSG